MVWNMSKGVVRRFRSGDKCWGMPAWHPAADRLLICTRGQDLVFWGAGGAGVFKLPHSVLGGAAWTYSRGLVFVCETTLHLYALAPGLHHPAHTHPISLPAGCAFSGETFMRPAQPPAVSSNGASLLLPVTGAGGSFHVAVVDCDSGTLRLHRVSFKPERLAWAPDAACAAVSSLQGDRHLLLGFA